MRFIVVTLTNVGDWFVYGPFGNIEAANQWADRSLVARKYRVAEFVELEKVVRYEEGA